MKAAFCNVGVWLVLTLVATCLVHAWPHQASNNNGARRHHLNNGASSQLVGADETWFKTEANSNGNGNGNKNFDYLVFRQIWPAATCLYPGHHTCAIAKNITTWVVHGLWPSIKSEIGPEFCNKSLPFNYASIKWLLPRLLEFWPNLYTDTPLDSFWQHEWEKHGTCALSLADVHTESDYFNRSLSLRDLFDFGPMLAAGQIVPDDLQLYDLEAIKSAIKSVLSVEPQLTCYVLKDSDVQYLSQMQICLSKQYELVECADEALELTKISVDNTPQETTCQPGMPVHYPIIKYE